jgi:ribose transport system ATP-binding protein
LFFDARPVSLAEYTVRKAKEAGIRVVHQELSVCTNLTVAENFFLELNQLFPSGPWRKKAGELAQSTLATIFPRNHVGPSTNVGSLSLAQQQMVEIGRAAADPRLKLLMTASAGMRRWPMWPATAARKGCFPSGPRCRT